MSIRGSSCHQIDTKLMSLGAQEGLVRGRMGEWKHLKSKQSAGMQLNVSLIAFYEFTHESHQFTFIK